jgi:PTH1 family peptidyl-tRNA hydrolase
VPDSPLLVIGLGNPGAEYEGSRHNVGYQVVDALADRLGVSFEHQQNALVGWGTHEGDTVGLALPLTYMNRSGDAVVSLREQHDLGPNQLLIIVDDLHLPLGTLRLRPNGSSGGHNGLAHIARRLDTTEYPRLRVGIGNDFPEGEQVDYVLSPFSDGQKSTIRDAITEAGDAALTVAHDDLEAAMNQFN